MRILITDSNGFIGKNLTAEMKNRGYKDLLLFDLDSDSSLLNQYTKECDFVFHLAGVNRPKNNDEFTSGNKGFTEELLDSLKQNNNTCPILLSSSIQATLDNPYGTSKKEAEDLFIKYPNKAFIFRLPNVFGKRKLVAHLV